MATKKKDDKGKTKEPELGAIPQATGEFNAARFGSAIHRRLPNLFNNAMVSDIRLKVGEEKLHCHRAILCAWSDTFNSMLSNRGWGESELEELPINVEPSDFENFKGMIEYMYKGTTDFITGDNVVATLALSDYYSVIPLNRLCGTLLGEVVSEKNINYLLDIAENYSCVTLEDACGNFLATNFGKMLEEEPEVILGMRLSTWVAMIKSDNLTIKSEQAVYESVIMYAGQFQDQKKEEALEALLPHIRWSYVKAELLVQLEEEGKYDHIPIFHKLLHETYRVKVVGASCKDREKAKSRLLNTTRRKGYLGWSFDPKTCNGNLQVLNDGQTVKYVANTSGHSSVLGDAPLDSGLHVWKVTITGGSSHWIGVGVCRKAEITPTLTADYDKMWGCSSANQLYKMSGPTQTWNLRDELICTLDFDADEFKIESKNKSTKISANGLCRGGPLFPIVNMYTTGNEVTISMEVD